MDDLIVFLASAAIALLIFALAARESRWWRIAVVPVWMFALGMALRICGRTYPGIHYPESAFLNDVFNGVWLFTGLGYNLVLALGVIDVVFVLLTRFRSDQPAENVVRLVAGVQAVLFALILAIIAYGFLVAVELERFPGFEHEGWGY